MLLLRSMIQWIAQGHSFLFDGSKAISLALPMVPNGNNVSCYYAEEPTATVIRLGDWVGSVAEGGSVNYQRLSLTPHGNGTHTECAGHILAGNALNMAVVPVPGLALAAVVDTPATEVGKDRVVLANHVLSQLAAIEQHYQIHVEAVVIKSIPASKEQLATAKYTETNPPYLESALGQALAERGINHLLVDVPSVDKEVDAGVLACHHGYWQVVNGEAGRPHATITELIDSSALTQGLYLLQLSWPAIAIDAVPSQPILFPLST